MKAGSIEERIRAGYAAGQASAVGIAVVVGLVALPVIATTVVAIRILDRRRGSGGRR